MAKKRRFKDDGHTFDPNHIETHQYNDYAGGQKNLSVGPALIPIKLTETSWTLDCTTPQRVGAGSHLAIYNTSGTTYSIRFGDDASVAAGAVGTIDSNGMAAIPCKGNDWTYLASSEMDWAVTNNAALLVFLIQDDTMMMD